MSPLTSRYRFGSGSASPLAPRPVCHITVNLFERTKNWENEVSFLYFPPLSSSPVVDILVAASKDIRLLRAQGS